MLVAVCDQPPLGHLDDFPGGKSKGETWPFSLPIIRGAAFPFDHCRTVREQNLHLPSRVNRSGTRAGSSLEQALLTDAPCSRCGKRLRAPVKIGAGGLRKTGRREIVRLPRGDRS
jgi:hypothetical protein